jgi:predicted nucleic acid-binding protein
LSIDLAGIIRKRKPAKRRARLIPRAPAELVAIASLDAGPAALMLDTNVYINIAAGRAADAVREAVDSAILFHSSVALAELATGVSNADPSGAGWPRMRDHYEALFTAIPASRLLAPDPDMWVDAGIIAGMLARTQGFQPHQRKECLNDTLIFLTAAKAGLTVLTANRVDFDLIQQIAPEGRFIYY